MAKKKMTIINDQARQGDVLVVRHAAPLRNAAEKPTDPRGVVLAEGEMTGHHHRIKDPGVCSLRAEGVSWDILQITEGLVGKLIHEEHSTIGIAGGTYEVRIQREHSWNAEAEEVSRAVAD